MHCVRPLWGKREVHTIAVLAIDLAGEQIVALKHLHPTDRRCDRHVRCFSKLGHSRLIMRKFSRIELKQNIPGGISEQVGTEMIEAAGPLRKRLPYVHQYDALYIWSKPPVRTYLFSKNLNVQPTLTSTTLLPQSISHFLESVANIYIGSKSTYSAGPRLMIRTHCRRLISEEPEVAMSTQGVRTNTPRPMAGCDRFIAKLSAASTISAADEEKLGELCLDARSAPAKSDIISEGENPEHVHIMLDGWAARCKSLPDGSRQITAFLIPGDFCDLHVSVLGQMDHAIVALTRARFACVPSEVMDDLPRARPELGRALWRATLIDEAILRSWIVNIGRREGRERIAHLFCELHARLSLVGLVEDDQFALPLTQDVIADDTGLTPMHVSRVLKTLRAQGHIILGDGKLTVQSIDKLRQIASFDASYLHRERLRRL